MAESTNTFTMEEFPLKPTPAIFTTRATLNALAEIERKTLPSLRQQHPEDERRALLQAMPNDGSHLLWQVSDQELLSCSFERSPTSSPQWSFGFQPLSPASSSNKRADVSTSAQSSAPGSSPLSQRSSDPVLPRSSRSSTFRAPDSQPNSSAPIPHVHYRLNGPSSTLAPSVNPAQTQSYTSPTGWAYPRLGEVRGSRRTSEAQILKVHEIIRAYIEQDPQDATDNPVRVEQEAHVEEAEPPVAGGLERVQSREDNDRRERQRLIAFALRSAWARRGAMRSGERVESLGEP